MKDSALVRALAHRGNASRIAKAIGISTGAVAQWAKCPAEHAKVVEAVTGVPRHELRPDLWEKAMPADPQPNLAGTASRPPASKRRSDAAQRSAARIALEEAQALLARYVDPADSLSAELIRDRREAAVQGD